MREKSERTKSVVGAHDDQPEPRKRGTQRSHLAVALSIAPTMEVNQHRAICIWPKMSGPYIQIQTVFMALDVRKPWRGKLRARRAEGDHSASSSPFRRRLWRSPPQFTYWRSRERDSEKCHLISFSS